MISVYNNGLKREVCMKTVLLMIATGLMMTSASLAAGCPLKNLNKSISRNDQSTNFYHVASNKSAASKSESFSGKSAAKQ